MLEPTVKSFSSLFAQVADIVGSHDGLNVGRESATSGTHIQIFIGEMDLNSLVDKFPKIRPVL
ncbi:MAG: hypothetical protein A3C85_00740 [Candidatus Doudnabacteria bacterium RIFCSPHIGHO2_02_FULL_48_21]|nr:MAG: hypothetical protein A3K05_04730 [Candidatus Doudnabacteria bacterium RIFCSPHIGHO2_01_48_18]OGE77290.1 MAG: hypothetical protein A2668_02580 [Candidatus Doudnabacteria bacterium RIFCSPHIGHO2_01_FULL_48_180]OGE91029.1 MAG: hypothetical protein A3F44_01750 [Candidatus Doudnabacteria bacterium RIFCSPHIGHO2_12_FULL_47_25]OGE92830.1 MAG: hypothetical protein A3C85_00740 [Candidatus Doudnabacteria bacterium RIFCSPHIGHO2_02_FULL_48_21]OGE96861.1 MAG: hypothetical protein A3A83_03975 [Candidatu